MSANADIEQLSNDIDQLAASLNRARLVSSLRELFESAVVDVLAEEEKALAARYQYSEDEIQVLPYKKQPPETLTLNENGQILQEVPIVKAENERLKEEIEKSLDTVLDRVNLRDDANQMNEFNSLLLEFQKKLKTFNAELPADITLLESLDYRWREMLDLTDICCEIAEDISRLEDMQNVGQKEKNSKADDSYGEIYIYSDDDEVEVIPYKKTPPEVVTLNDDGDIVPEADVAAAAADIEKLKDETLETLATIYREIETCNDAEQRKEFRSMLLDIKKKLKDFDAHLPHDD